MKLLDFLEICKVKRFIINIIHTINNKTIIEEYYIIRNIYKELPLKYFNYEILVISIFDDNTLVITLKH